MSVSYTIRIAPVTRNKDDILEILINVTGSEKRARELVRSGGVMTVEHDENDIPAWAKHLMEAGAQVEFELKPSQRETVEECVVEGAVLGASIEMDTPLTAIDGIGTDRAGELGELGYEEVADVMDADGANLTEATDVGDVLAKRILETTRRDPIPGLTVRAFDRDLRSEQLLGEATTDEQGRYTIAYTPDRFSRSDTGRADLVLRVFDETGAELDVEAEKGELPETDAEGEPRKTVFDADPVEQVDLTVDASTRRVPSEYERLRRELTPLLDGVSPGDLTDEDVWFLINETGLERAWITAFADAAAVGRETNLPAALFYGLIRNGLPAELANLLEVPPETLKAALEDAIDETIVRPRVMDSFDELLERFEQRQAQSQPRVGYELVATVLRGSTREPLSRYGVTVIDVTTDPERLLGEGITDGDGRVAFGFTLLEATDPTRQVQFEISDRRGSEKLVATRTVELDRDEPAPVTVAVPELDRPGSIALQDGILRETLLGSAPDSDRMDRLLTTLQEREQPLGDLADVREAGGLTRLLERTENPPIPPDDPAVGLLDAHVYLSLLSSNPAVNARLIERGYSDPFAIANAPRGEFVDSVSGDDTELTVFEAHRMHYAARAQRYAMNNALTTLLTDRANGIATDLEEAE